jgi:hypothetical protein
MALAIAASLARTEADDSLSAAAQAVISAAAIVLELDDMLLATLNTTPGLSAQHGAWLEAIARVHAVVMGATLYVTDSSPVDGVKTDGVLVQSMVAGVLTTTAAPSGAPGPSSLTDDQANWLEGLARIYGLIDPMAMTQSGRSDGTFVQSISEAGPTVVYTRLA